VAASAGPVIVTAAEHGTRLCTRAVYAIAAALVVLEALAVATSLFTGSETTRAGAGFVLMFAAGLAATAYTAPRLTRAPR
jgi:hypothetical protein